VRWLALTLPLLFPALASAHLDLIEPPARYDRDELKDGPCGIPGGARGDTVAVFEPGATIAITLEEYIDHPSHYRVAFDEEGDDDFQDPVCVEHCESGPEDPVFAPSEGGTILADVVADDPAISQTFEVTLPDVECDRCTLQVIQVMYDKKPITVGGNDIYYHCADIALVRGAETMDLGVLPPRPDLGPPPPDGGPVADLDGGAGSDGDDGGCSASGPAGAGACWLLLSLVALRRRGGSSRRAPSGSARASGRGRA
jgi:uncharacterized protein (TIGR03382 family)